MTISSVSNHTASVEQTKSSYNIADMKKESDKRIVEAQLEVSLKDGPSVMSLLFRTAIEEINKHIPTTGKESTIEKAYENNLDVSPEATAKRILTGATSFFNAYKKQNSDLSENEALTQFMDVIRNGIDTGFGEARNILDKLSVLEDEIASEIDLTYDFVQKGLNEFSQKITTKLEEETSITNPEQLNN